MKLVLPNIMSHMALTCILLLSFVLRLLYLRDLGTTPFFENLSLDPEFYDASALRIIGGDYWLGREPLDMGPIYSYFIAGVYILFGHSLMAVRFIQIVIGTGSVFLLYQIALILFDRKTALIAAGMAALYAPFIFMEGNLESESLVIFSNLVLVYVLMRAGKIGTPFLWLISGMVLGLSAIIRPNILLLAPLVALWVFILYTPRAALSRCAVFTFGILLLVLPVTARNYLVGADGVLITSSGGFNFYLGNNPDASGILNEPDFIRPDPVYEHGDARREAERRTGKKLKASEASSFWFQQGLQYIVDDPIDFINLLSDKIFWFANAYEVPDNLNFQFMQRFSHILRLPLLHYGIVFPFAILGAIMSLPNWQKYAPLYLMTASYLLFLILFYVTSRYRLPLVPFLILFAAHGGRQISVFFREKALGRGIAAMILILIFFIFSNWETGSVERRFAAQSHNTLGAAYYAGGELDRAIAEFERGAILLPGDPYIGNNIAWAYAVKGVNLKRAKEHALMATSRRPEDAEFLVTLAFVHSRMGDQVEAEALLKKAVVMEPKNEEIRRRFINLVRDKKWEEKCC